jgi:hypothetical protein
MNDTKDDFAHNMTLRDYFAAHAPSKIPDWFRRIAPGMDEQARYFQWRYAYADEMLRARG